jgi:hypothetical protein
VAAARPGERLDRALADRGLEWFSAAVMVAWGLTLALPGDTLDDPAFAAFRTAWTGEVFWAAAFGLAGGARLAALYVNGRSPRTPFARMAGALFGALSWGQVAWLVTAATWGATGIAQTGTGLYGLLALADLFSIFRAAHDARYQHP